MSPSARTALLEERAPRRRPSLPVVVLAVVAAVAGAVFGVILASPLGVRPWLAAVVAVAYTCVILVAGGLLLDIPAPR